MAYIGYFKSLHSDLLYSVTIRKKGDTSTPTEIPLAGTEPFKVSYAETKTIFEPIKTSTATIRVVSDNYLEDILPSRAQETEVLLTNETMGYYEWVGYLTPKVYNQEYENEFEEIELEAADVLSSTQYIDYRKDEVSTLKTFQELIGEAFNGTLINSFYWPRTKMIEDKLVLPEHLKISNKNFYTNDTDEPWSYQEILEEMAKYLGLSCVQWQSYIYFIDTASNSSTYDVFLKDRGWERGYSEVILFDTEITEDDIRGAGETISFEPIYNKICVRDNFYTCDDFISNIFDDNALTNRGGDFYSKFEVDSPPSGLSDFATYPWGGWLIQKYAKDCDKNNKIPDSGYYFWHRLYDHKDYESVYYTPSLSNTVPYDLNSVNTTRDYVGATICDLGTVRKNYVNDTGQLIVENKVNWERYLLISQKGNGWENYPSYIPVFRTKEGLKGNVMLDEKLSYIIINYSVIFEKHEDRNYINPVWKNESADLKTNSTLIERCGRLAFCLKIGKKYWDGNKWTEKSSLFTIANEREGKDDFATFNVERPVLNNVSWDLGIDGEGYKISLEEVDTSEDIMFEILLPRIQLITEYDDDVPRTQYNQYCWVKDLSIKVATLTEDKKEVEENDVVYENIIDAASIYELTDIELKFTTSAPNTKPAFSNVVYYDGEKNSLLTYIDEDVLPDKKMKPEENIIQRYYHQYSTISKKLSYTLPVWKKVKNENGNYNYIDIKPFDRFYGMDVDNPNIPYIQNGLEIDYARDTQIMTLVQKK